MVLCTGHIGIHEGADGRSSRHGYKTKFSHIDGLQYFLNYGAPRAHAERSSAIIKSDEFLYWMKHYISFGDVK